MFGRSIGFSFAASRSLAAATVAAACLATAPSTASAVLIASDGFELATHPGGNRQAVAGNGIQFFTRNADPGAGTASIVTDAAVGGAAPQALAVTNTSGAGAAFPVIGKLPLAATLNNVNDNVTLTFKFRFLNAAAATDSNGSFRFGLHYAAPNFVYQDNTGGHSDSHTGYYAQIGDAAQTTGNLFYVENGGTSSILSGTDRANITASAGVAAITDATSHSAVFSLTRTSATTIGLSLSIDGGAAVTGTATSPATTLRTTFDEVTFADGFATTQLNFAIDDITVDATASTVPEPGSAAALAGAVGLLLARRRRAARN